MKSGSSSQVFIPLRKKRVNRALGKRRRMTVTFSQNFDRIKNGRKVGEANKRKRFKMGAPEPRRVPDYLADTRAVVSEKRIGPRHLTKGPESRAFCLW